MLPLSIQQKNALLREAQSHMARGALGPARTALERVAKADPNRPDVAYQLSRIAYEQGDRAACLSHLETAVRLDPSNATLNKAAAARFRQFGQAEQALAAYDRLIASERSALAPKADKAHYLQLLGRFDDAESLFRKLIKAHPDEAELYRLFLASKKLAKGDPLLRKMETLWATPRLPDGARISLGYALAKALEESGQTDRVFPVLNRANALQRKAAPFDSAAQGREFAGVLAAQEGLDLSPHGDTPPLRPVFVTGMPRSGTTLVERILGVHSDVSTGGELGHALKLAYGMFGVGEDMRPLDREPAKRLDQFASRYLTLSARDTGRDTGVFTDKSILSHLIFGLLNRTLPGARIIVVHRDPRDIALSIYKNHFGTGTHRYANALPDIAEAIKRFRANVAHWKSRMPGVIHDIRYEDLVADPEPQSRALVAAAGLDWQEACLDFHSSGGAVKTLSVAQVREPIHGGRTAAWRKFETELAPFIEAWGDDPWD